MYRRWRQSSAQLNSSLSFRLDGSLPRFRMILTVVVYGDLCNPAVIEHNDTPAVPFDIYCRLESLHHISGGELGILCKPQALGLQLC